MGLLLQQVIFYTAAAAILFSSVMVVIVRHPVRSALFLVFSFFLACVIWMLLQAEFLALVLIFVYIGAVMTLFLFVIMMLNLNVGPARKSWIAYLPLAVLIIGLLIIAVLSALSPDHFDDQIYKSMSQPETYSNAKALGAVLYTDYVYPFEIAAVLLLVAIISAVCLAFRGKRKGVKSQNLSDQHNVKPSDRVRLVNMPTEKK